jgi:DNA-binding MarR family transcriptional regulator
VDVEPLIDNEEVVWRSLMRLEFTLPRGLGDDLQRSCGLSSTEYSVLMHLSESPDAQPSMSDLANRTSLSPSRISRVIARVARLPVVERRPGSVDGRTTVATVMIAGADLESSAADHLRSVRERAFDHLTADEVRTLGPAQARREEAGDEQPSPKAPLNFACLAE